MSLGPGVGPTRPAGLALALPWGGEWSQAGSVGCSEWLQDLKGCGLEWKFSLEEVSLWSLCVWK